MSKAFYPRASPTPGRKRGPPVGAWLGDKAGGKSKGAAIGAGVAATGYALKFH